MAQAFFENLGFMVLIFAAGFTLCAFCAYVLQMMQAKRNQLQIQLDQAQQYQQWQREFDEQSHQLRQKILQLESSGLQWQTRYQEQRLLLQAKESDIERLRAQATLNIQLQAQIEEQQRSLSAEKAWIEQTKQGLFKEFESSANKLFEAKQESFRQSSTHQIETVLNPFKAQLNAFNKKVEDVYATENNQRNQLLGQIVELQRQTQKISSDANNLAKALKGDNKIQGDWGEIILERLLEQSGLRKGREYDVQQSFVNADGRRVRPDVIVHLPENKDIVVDSKVSLKDYEIFSKADAVEIRQQALVRHVDSLKKHIRVLSEKKYEQLDGAKALEFVFIFVPVEAAYLCALEASPGLFSEAYDRNIVLVSPSSLMVALRTVETIWRYEKQNSNAEKIAESAGRLYDQFALVVESLEDLGGLISRTEQSYDKLVKRLSTGRGNVFGRVGKLKDLGAKTSKTLSASMQLQMEQSVDDLSGDEVADSTPTGHH